MDCQWLLALSRSTPNSPPRQVQSFAQVASLTGPCHIPQVVGPAVLLGDDVLDVEGGGRRSEVRKVAVLASTLGPLADKLAKTPRHQASAEHRITPRALACRIAMKSIVCT